MHDHPETAPAWSIVRYEFPAQGSRPPVKLVWYDGGKLPPLELFDGHTPAKGSSGSIFVGEKGRLLVGRERGRGYRLLPERDFAGFVAPKPTLPRSPGHHAEWIEACKTGKPTGTSFDYCRPAHRAGPAGQRRAPRRAADRVGRSRHAVHERIELTIMFIHRDYRRGWVL